MAEGMPIKQTVGSIRADEGGRCTTCRKIRDVTIYDTDIGRKMLCDECDREDDKQRYGRA